MRYSVKAAAIATGISESRLRTWERRYGVPAPRRTASGRRQYDEQDLAIIRRMAVLVEAGVAASQAAEAVRLESLSELVSPEPTSHEHPLVDLFVHKAEAFDQGWLLRIIRDSVYSAGWAPTLERIVFPALYRLGHAWEQASASATSEHFASEVLRCELSAELSRSTEPASNGACVLLACPEGEGHDLGLLALALLLRRRQVTVLYLGARVPLEDLIDAVERVRPAALCLAATTANSLSALHRTARGILALRFSVQLFVGGPALNGDNGSVAIPGILMPRSVAAAADRVAGSLNGSPRRTGKEDRDQP